jgi:phosphonate transport system substrate-binding protein
MTTVTRRMVLAAAPLFLAGAAAAQAPDALEVAIFPFYSTRVLLERHEPLRKYLEARLKRPVVLTTTHDFKTFILRTRERRFPVILTGPHLGRIAQVEDGYHPLALTRARIQGIFLVHRDSPFRSLADLRGRAIGTPDLLAMITMLGLEALGKAGVATNEVRLSPQPTHNAAALSILRGENDAALVWVNTANLTDPEAAQKLRVIAETEALPTGTMFLAHPELPVPEGAAIRTALLEFGDTGDGRAFMAAMSYNGFVPVRDEDVAYLDRYVPLTHRLLGER